MNIIMISGTSKGPVIILIMFVILCGVILWGALTGWTFSGTPGDAPPGPISDVQVEVAAGESGGRRESYTTVEEMAGLYIAVSFNTPKSSFGRGNSALKDYVISLGTASNNSRGSLLAVILISREGGSARLISRSFNNTSGGIALSGDFNALDSRVSVTLSSPVWRDGGIIIPEGGVFLGIDYTSMEVPEGHVYELGGGADKPAGNYTRYFMAGGVTLLGEVKDGVRFVVDPDVTNSINEGLNILNGLPCTTPDTAVDDAAEYHYQDGVCVFKSCVSGYNLSTNGKCVLPDGTTCDSTADQNATEYHYQNGACVVKSCARGYNLSGGGSACVPAPYITYGSGSCTNDWASQLDLCADENDCDAIGQDSDGCWQKYKGVTLNEYVYSQLNGGPERMFLRKNQNFAQFYLGSAGCTGVEDAEQACRDAAKCTAVAKQNNGCWHTLQNTGSDKKFLSDYTEVILRKALGTAQPLPPPSTPPTTQVGCYAIENAGSCNATGTCKWITYTGYGGGGAACTLKESPGIVGYTYKLYEDYDGRYLVPNDGGTGYFRNLRLGQCIELCNTEDKCIGVSHGRHTSGDSCFLKETATSANDTSRSYHKYTFYRKPTT